METIIISNEELDSIKESGSNLKTLRASAIPAGLYDVLSIDNFTVQSREEIASSLEAKGKDSSWCSGLPDANIKGIIKIEKNGVASTFYLNNALFNLCVEQGVLASASNSKSNKKTTTEFLLTDNQLKIS